MKNLVLKAKVVKDSILGTINEKVNNKKGNILVGALIVIALLMAVVAFVPALRTWATALFNSLTSHTTTEVNKVINP